jgi:glycosyltransferase involved in cell wall biosynthesis
VNLFQPPLDRPRNKGICRFLFVGRCIAVKNLEFLVRGFGEALRQRPDLTLRIVGDGESVPALKSRVSELGIQRRVEFVGFQAGADLARHYQWADCFTLVSRFESFSLVALEAMSSGLPLILSRVGHLPTFINEYNAGTLIEPDNVRELADAMIHWADHPELRQEIEGRNRQTVVSRFSWQASARKLLAYYETILAEPRSAGVGA